MIISSASGELGAADDAAGDARAAAGGWSTLQIREPQLSTAQPVPAAPLTSGR